MHFFRILKTKNILLPYQDSRKIYFPGNQIAIGDVQCAYQLYDAMASI